MGRSPSFLWRSFYNARSLLETGLRWRIGNGVKVRIGDKWLPKPGTFKLSLPHCTLDTNSRVADLIDRTAGRWKVEVLRGKVANDDLDLIKTIPISIFPKQDRLVWHFTQHGAYSVKSGYYIALQRKRSGLYIGESSNQSSCSGFWKRLWNLRVPPKVKNFLWRACREILPVRERLFRKGIGPSKVCPVCNAEDETVLHALVRCSAANVVWFASSLGLRSDMIMGSSFFDWFDAIVQ